MSTTPQMSQPGQQQGQQFPSTSPYQQQQQQPFGQQGFGMGGGSLEQLQQLGQQQPYQQLLQQLGQQQQQPQQQVEQQVQQHLQQIAQIAVQYIQQQIQQQALQAGIANSYIDVVQPLPGQPSLIALVINNQLRILFNPDPQTHDQVQEAFAFGHQVIGIWDSATPQILRSIQIRKF